MTSPCSSALTHPLWPTLGARRDTINYEIVTNLGAHIPRAYIGDVDATDGTPS